MRCLKFSLAIGLLVALAALPSFAGSDEAVDTPIISCGNGVPGGISCIPSRKDLKEAHNAYSRGLKLEDRRDFDQAFLEFDEASRLVPRDTQFFSAREVAKSQLVFQHTERGDQLLADGHRDPAAAEFRAALKLDPDNDYIQGRLADALQNETTANSALHPSSPIPLKSICCRKPIGQHFTIVATFAASSPNWLRPMALPLSLTIQSRPRPFASTWTTLTSSLPSTWRAASAKPCGQPSTRTNC